MVPDVGADYSYRCRSAKRNCLGLATEKGHSRVVGFCSHGSGWGYRMGVVKDDLTKEGDYGAMHTKTQDR